MSSNARRPHRITRVDSDARRGVCSICGPTWIKRKERRGFVSWTCGQLHGSYSATASARLSSYFVMWLQTGRRTAVGTAALSPFTPPS